MWQRGLWTNVSLVRVKYPGFYPICPGDTRYSLGRPSFEKVEITLENGALFTVIAENLSEDHPYVQEVWLNGVKLTEPYLQHADTEAGSTLTFVMGSEKTVFWN